MVLMDISFSTKRKSSMFFLLGILLHQKVFLLGKSKE
uniref:Uncharacterized protein n=1 Tax=Arundo donax TaxID=35708 RepID=A0A0A9CB71_ARUDO